MTPERHQARGLAFWIRQPLPFGECYYWPTKHATLADAILDLDVVGITPAEIIDQNGVVVMRSERFTKRTDMKKMTTPITLTIEHEEPAVLLWHFLNDPCSCLNVQYPSKTNLGELARRVHDDNGMELWRRLDEALTGRKIDPEAYQLAPEIKIHGQVVTIGDDGTATFGAVSLSPDVIRQLASRLPPL